MSKEMQDDADLRAWIRAWAQTLDTHEDCEWEQIGPCVYCKPHQTRLFQGRLPENRRAVPKCETHTWDEVCGEQEWPDD